MQNYKILWADDEIDLLKPHILFLSQKGYQITTVNSGIDAIEKVEEEEFDLVFLDEMMPGMTGLETLQQVKLMRPQLPVVMITKSEEEHIMDDAIGGKIADYLIKPINPNQILLSAKKILQNKQLITEKTNLSYRQDFMNISMACSDADTHEEWTEIYKKLTYWELEIDKTENKSMQEVLDTQKVEANSAFAKFVKKNYVEWLKERSEDKPLLSHRVLRERVFPHLKSGRPLFLVVIDNLRMDQWEILEPLILQYFSIKSRDAYYSILPTTTAFARNALFSGLMPSDMARFHPDLWEGEDTDEAKNNKEEEFLGENLHKHRLSVKYSYHKILQANQGKQVLDNFNNLLHNDLNALVYNFVDMMSHARTDMKMMRELAPNESAYRSLTKSWFEHSSLFELFKRVADAGAELIVTTDHGTKRVNKPYKIIGDRNVTTNLRYKQGKNLNFESGKVFEIERPEDAKLPRFNVTTSYVFAVEDYFFAYPNNYNYYVNYFKDTFQHGGVSLEEMIVPLVHLKPK
ncbi:response regulator receiver protein [Nitritalea halalkaliphila LW7]|uniref:Response regulator receiver protein n=1 Tax=Nitritalea halalkaliphila LW7 TaxID=1189621 RepID=I5C1H2_9BACT|nr:PglZ domain-containing protein [Nitritalea halalkaliphila]EIM75674.1 response regulator receiver protein [Nitritalea halalkaliphila LW7]